MATMNQKAVAGADEELSPRWAAFLELYLSTGNARVSAIQVGFSENYADIITTRFPEKVRKRLTEALEDRGITSDKIAEKIHVLLEAKNGKKPDYGAVDRGITHAIKIGVGGGYEPEKKAVLHGHINGSEPLAKEYEERLRAQMLRPPEDNG